LSSGFPVGLNPAPILFTFLQAPLRLSVSSQFDGPMITIDDGVWPSLSVIGDGVPANVDIAIKLSDVHQDHDHKRLQR
jgi:hypothetical protein